MLRSGGNGASVGTVGCGSGRLFPSPKKFAQMSDIIW